MEQQNTPPTLSFEGRMYKVDDMNPEARQAAETLIANDRQLQMASETLHFLQMARSVSLANLRETLKDVPSVEDPAAVQADEPTNA